MRKSIRLLAVVVVLACAPAAGADARDEARVARGRAALVELADLELERPLARGLAEELIGGLAFGLTDELHLVLRALDVRLEPGALTVPLRWLLGVLDLRGLEVGSARALFERGADPRALARLSIVLEGSVAGCRACVEAADELLLGLTQLLNVVLKAVATVEKLSGRVEILPGAGRAARAIRRAIVKRLVRAADSVVYLATRPLKQPLRSRLRAAAAVLVTALFRFDPTASGLPGPATGAVLVAKAYLLGNAHRGAFARIARAVERASALAAAGTVRGTLAAAEARALAGPAGSPAVLEAVLAEAKRRSRAAGIERHSAKLAGVASDIALLLSLADPTGIAKVVAAVSRALQGTLVLHATWLSGSMLHKLPREVSRLVDIAFDPDGGRLPGEALQPVPARAKASRPDGRTAAARGVDVALDRLVESLDEPVPGERTAAAVDALESASDTLVARVHAAEAGPVPPAAARFAGLLEHDLAAAALLAGRLAGGVGKAPAARVLLARVDDVRRAAAALAAPVTKLAEPPDPAPQLVIDAPAAVSVGEGRALAVHVENAGPLPARAVEVMVAVPGAPVTHHRLGDLAPGGSARIAVSVPAGGAGGTALIHARDAGHDEAARAVWLRP